MPRRLATLRSAGVGLMLAAQDTIQLDTLYTPEGRRLITSTCQAHIVFGGVGQEDAAWVSSRLGTATVVGKSANAGRQRGDILVGQGGYTRGETGRPLLTPEEIQQLPEGYLILNGLHARPTLVRAVPWYKVRALRHLAARANELGRRRAHLPVAQTRAPHIPWDMEMERDREPARGASPIAPTEPATATPEEPATEKTVATPAPAPDKAAATSPRTPRAKAPAKGRTAPVAVADEDPFAAASKDE